VNEPLRRGDIVVVVGPGAFSTKPRPALVVQSDLFNDTHASVTVCLVTTEIVDAGLFRVAVAPTVGTGLKPASQVMVDKVAAVPRANVGQRLGRIDPAMMMAVDQALRVWLAM
jgi:mRNA interferase MazF